eukprot:1015538-Amphidinium_carterae.1
MEYLLQLQLHVSLCWARIVRISARSICLEAALGRENLNLQRLTRGNEPLRVAIAHAWQAWHVITSQAQRPPRPQSPGASQSLVSHVIVE